ncbi:MAG TPA: hypothetical protein DEP35_25230 [Deltaproteobacteria bacterium]|jgi:hypothetical protein|nr:hypothetical protein [Deltaproteobacteria bacterium]
MARLKTGTRLKSAVCNTQVMVVAAPDAEVQLTCGGQPLIDAAATPTAGAVISPDAAKGTTLGKRYVNADGTLELLCIKPGEGSLAVAGEALRLKEAKPLPSSD